MGAETTARGQYTTESGTTEQGALGDEASLALLCREVQCLSRERRSVSGISIWAELRALLPASVRRTTYAQELIARLHTPEARLLLLDLAVGPRLDQLAFDFNLETQATRELIAQVRRAVREPSWSTESYSGAKADRRCGNIDARLANCAVVEIDALRAALVQRISMQLTATINELFVTRERVASVLGLSEVAFRKRLERGKMNWPPSEVRQLPGWKRPRAGWTLETLRTQPELSAEALSQLGQQPV